MEIMGTCFLTQRRPIAAMRVKENCFFAIMLTVQDARRGGWCQGRVFRGVFRGDFTAFGFASNPIGVQQRQNAGVPLDRNRP
jgi:hypothetical protein